MARPSRPSQAEADLHCSAPNAAHFRPAAGVFFVPLVKAGRLSHLSVTGATGRKTPLALGVFRKRASSLVFCRFCHFRVLTPKMVSHITRLAVDDGLAARPRRFQDKAEVLPGNRKNPPVPKN
jgi:hypothetical protein